MIHTVRRTPMRHMFSTLLIVAMGIAACSPVSQAVITPTSPPTDTLTPSATPTPTRTLTPTSTPLPVSAQAQISDDPNRSIVLSPDGRHLAVSDRFRLHMYWTDTLAEIWAGQIEGDVLITFSPDSSLLVSLLLGYQGPTSARADAWDVETGALLHSLDGFGPMLSSEEWSPGGSYILALSSAHDVILWDARTGDTVLTLRGEPFPAIDDSCCYQPHRAVYGIAWSPDGSMIAATYITIYDVTPVSDYTIKVWSTSTGALLRRLESNPGEGLYEYWWELAWSPGDVLVSWPQGGTHPIPDATPAISEPATGRTLLWNASTGEVLAALGQPGEEPGSVAWSPDGAMLATAVVNGIATIWNSATWEILDTVSNPPEKMTYGPDRNLAYPTLIWSPDGTRLAYATGIDYSANESGTDILMIWNHGGGANPCWLEDEFDGVENIVWSPDSAMIGYSTEAGMTIICDAATGSALRKAKDAGHFIGWLPDNSAFITVTDDGLLRRLEMDPSLLQDRPGAQPGAADGGD